MPHTAEHSDEEEAKRDISSPRKPICSKLQATFRSSQEDLPKKKKFLNRSLSKEERLTQRADYSDKKFAYLAHSIKEMRQETNQQDRYLIKLKTMQAKTKSRQSQLAPTLDTWSQHNKSCFTIPKRLSSRAFSIKDSQGLQTDRHMASLDTAASALNHTSSRHNISIID